MNWEEFEDIARTNKELTTNKHKTGKFYTVHIFIMEDQRNFLRKMKEKYVEEFGVAPRYVFASTVNEVESSICRGLQEVFYETFGDNPAEVRFNANSIRKFWERMWTVIKGQVSEGVTKAHLAQTAHSEKTAQERYLSKNGTREDRIEVLHIYADRLLGPKEDEDGVHENCAAPEDEQVDSDFDDSQALNESLVPPTPLVPTPRETRFNLIRDSLQPSPLATITANDSHHPPSSLVNRIARPMPPTARDSLNSTLEERIEPTAVDKFMKSLRNFRVKANAPPWSEEEKKACLLFTNCRGTVSEPEVRKRIEEGGYQLTAPQCHRIYAKIKTATGVFRKK